MKIQIINKSKNQLPEYAMVNDSGMDLKASLNTCDIILDLEKEIEGVILRSFAPTLIETGIYVNIPMGFEGQIRPKSGLTSKGIVAQLGTVDAGYVGELKVCLINLTKKDQYIADGQKIAQIVFNRIEQAEWVEVSEHEETERGEGGFGSTGKF